jgi:hypothetical protein
VPRLLRGEGSPGELAARRWYITVKPMRPRCVCAAVLFFCLAASAVSAQQASPALPAAQLGTSAEFVKAADEVLADMSKLLSLPVREPLKKSVRTKDEIRAYLIGNLKEEKDSAKLRADVRVLELLGLLPKDYPLEQKLIDLLTDQIAGVYDPKGREFFIAASTGLAEQRVIMAHELTHALEDQNFHVERWTKAAKDNDDASLARSAVLEGSATVAMIDYLLRDAGTSFRDLGSFDPTLILGDADTSPEMKDVPLVIRDQLFFPYFSGAAFSVKALDAAGGWAGLHTLFEKPPASTQQIMHPDLYLRGVQPEDVKLPRMKDVVPRGWKKLDENVMGEFGLNLMFKQFLGKARADELAAGWSGDRYAIYEESPEGRALLVLRVRLAGEPEAAKFFAGYSELLEKRHASPGPEPLREPNALFFEPPAGGAFIRCSGRECLLGEGATRAEFDALGRAVGWPALSARVAPMPPVTQASAFQPLLYVPPVEALPEDPAAR